MNKKTELRTVPVGDDESHRVHRDFKNKLATTPQEGAETLYDLAEYGFKNYKGDKAMGWRAFLGWKNKKVKEFGETSWLTFGQVGEKSKKFGAALRAAGLQPAPPTTNLEKVTTVSILSRRQYGFIF